VGYLTQLELDTLPPHAGPADRMQCMFDLQSDTCIATDRGSVFRCSRRLSGTPSPDQL